MSNKSLAESRGGRSPLRFKAATEELFLLLWLRTIPTGSRVLRPDAWIQWRRENGLEDWATTCGGGLVARPLRRGRLANAAFSMIRRGAPTASPELTDR